MKHEFMQHFELLLLAVVADIQENGIYRLSAGTMGVDYQATPRIPKSLLEPIGVAKVFYKTMSPTTSGTIHVMFERLNADVFRDGNYMAYEPDFHVCLSDYALTKPIKVVGEFIKAKTYNALEGDVEIDTSDWGWDDV